MYLNITDILLITSIIQSLVLAVFLLLPGNIGLVSNRLLLATVIFFAAGLAEIFLYGTGLALRHPNFAYLGTLLGLLQAGTLYLYAKSLMYHDFRLRWQHAVHTLLFWVVAAIFLVEYYLQPVEVKLQILQQRDHPGVLTSPLLAVAIHLVFLGYLYATIRTINRFGVDVRQVFSNIGNKQLARQLELPPRELSRAINQGFGQNFFEFVSGYRLEEARRRLEDGDNSDSILQIMYDSGFNSKSVFNTAFKKATGMTPSQYRARPA